MHLLLLWPWGLLGLLPVAVAAYWSLRRPAPRVLNVATLWLWQRAMQTAGQSPTARGRPLLGWLLMLLACTLLVLAICQPVLVRSRPVRRVEIAIVPSFELIETPRPFTPALALLDQLGAEDRVRLLRPEESGGSTDYLSPADARREIARLDVLPQSATDIVMPEPAGDAQQSFRFAAIALPPRPGVIDCRLPVLLPSVHVDTLAASCAAPSKTEAFIRFANSTDQPREAEAKIATPDSPPISVPLSLPARGSAETTLTLPGRPTYLAATTDPSSPLAARYLALSAAGRVRLALLGRQDPNLRRFAQADPLVELVADPSKAQVIFAVGIDEAQLAQLTQRPDMPALLIVPPQPPEGVVDDGAGEALSLSAAAHSDDSVLAGVDLSRAVLRTYRQWNMPAVAGNSYDSLISFDGHPLLLLSRQRPRAYLAFDVTSWNTNLAISEAAFPILLHNIVRHLCPDSGGTPQYTSHALAPMGAASKAVISAATSWPDDRRWPAPGIFLDPAGHPVALNAPVVDFGALASSVSTPTPVDVSIPLAEPSRWPLWPYLVECTLLLICSLPFLRSRRSLHHAEKPLAG